MNIMIKTDLGQAAMTEAMFDWLEDDSAGHPLNLESALSDFGVILALYTSALRHQVVELPIRAAGAFDQAIARDA